MEQSFKNQFLIALPGLSGDYFEHSITLMIDHTADGAFGLVVNKPLQNRIHELFPDLPQNVRCPLLEGGPVEQDKIFFLHGSAAQFDNTLEVGKGIRLTTSEDFIDALHTGKAPGETIACLGYAGWAASQLETELAENVWLLCPAAAKILFKTPFADRASEAARQLGVDLNLIGPVPGHD